MEVIHMRATDLKNRYEVTLTDANEKKHRLVIRATNLAGMFNQIARKYGHYLVDEDGIEIGTLEWIQDQCEPDSRD